MCVCVCLSERACVRACVRVCVCANAWRQFVHSVKYMHVLSAPLIKGITFHCQHVQSVCEK